MQNEHSFLEFHCVHSAEGATGIVFDDLEQTGAAKAIQRGARSGVGLAELVLRELKRIDKVAYVRFASVYRSFEDVDEFRQLIRDI